MTTTFRLPLLAALLASVLAAAACGGGSSGSSAATDAATTASPATTSAASESDRVYRVGIDISFHPLWDYVVAKQDEYFGDKPYEVEFKVLDATTLVPAFGKGDLDVLATLPSFLPRIDQRYGIVASMFFPMARVTPGTILFVPNDSPAQTIEDLEGKKVAVLTLGQLFGEEEAVVEAATGTPIREYFDLQESGTPAQQLILGRVDGAWVSGPNVTEVLATGKFRPLVTAQQVYAEVLGDPRALSGGMAASREFLDGNADFVADLMAAFHDAWDRYAADPQAVNEVASQESGIPVEQLTGFGSALDLEGTPRPDRVVTERDVETWSQIFAFLAASGFLDEAPADPAAFFQVAA